MKIDRDTYEAWLLDRLEGRLSAAQERALDAFLAANPDLPGALGDLPSIDVEMASFGDRAGLKRSFPPQGLPDAARIDDFLIARGEGDLSPDQLKAVERFLFEHPEQERTARLVAAARVPALLVPMLAKAKLEKHFPPVGMPDRARIMEFLIAAAEGDLDADRMAMLKVLVAGDAGLQSEQRRVQAARIAADPVIYANKEGLKKGRGRVVPLWSARVPMVRFAAAASLLLLLGLAWWLLREAPAAGGEVARKDAPATQRPSTAPVEAEQPGVRVQMPPANKAGREAFAPSEAPVPEHRKEASTPLEVPVPVQPGEEEPNVAQQPTPPAHEPVSVPEVVTPLQQEAPVLQAAAAPTGSYTVRELLATELRERVLDRPADDRPLDGKDAVALADKGLKGLTRGTGGVEVHRTTKRDRFKIRLGEGLAFSGSIGR